MRSLVARTVAILGTLVVVLLLSQRLAVMAYWETHPIAHEQANQFWAYMAARARSREAATQAEVSQAQLEKQRQDTLALPLAKKEIDPAALSRLLDLRPPANAIPKASK